MARCLGPLCGRFHDEIGGSSSDENDEDLDESKASSKANMTAKKKHRARNKKKTVKAEQDTVKSAAFKWAQYIHHADLILKDRGIETTVTVVHLRIVSNSNVTPGMMGSIHQLPQIHTVEIVKCQCEGIPPYLNELDGFAVFRMPQNSITTFPEDLAKCKGLTQIVLDSNVIREISPGVFSTHAFGNLEVLSLAENQLNYLPNDFGVTANRNSLKFIDLSNNMIQTIPESILQCRRLEELNLSHNRLKALPDDFDLNKLSKLFLSFNQLARLPSQIGKCSSLTKLRIVSNQVRELPESILDLWQQRGGVLEELLVDRNPLVVPSITAFEMERGSIDRAFGLLAEHLEEQQRRRSAASLALTGDVEAVVAKG